MILNEITVDGRIVFVMPFVYDEYWRSISVDRRVDRKFVIWLLSSTVMIKRIQRWWREWRSRKMWEAGILQCHLEILLSPPSALLPHGGQFYVESKSHFDGLVTML